MTQQWFKEQIQLVDSLAEVDFISIPHGIRVRPSHPRYFDAVCKVARACMPAGALVSVCREVDHFLAYSAPKPLTGWQRARLLLQRGFKVGGR